MDILVFLIKTLTLCFIGGFLWGVSQCWGRLFFFSVLEPEYYIIRNYEKEDFTMKTYLILAVIGACIGALVGGIAGWLVGLIWPCVIVGTAAGLVGIFTWNKWPGWFATQYVDTWHSGAIMFVLCVVFASAIGAFTGWGVRGLGLGALFGVIVIGMSYGIRRLSLNVQ